MLETVLPAGWPVGIAKYSPTSTPNTAPLANEPKIKYVSVKPEIAPIITTTAPPIKLDFIFLIPIPGIALS